MKQLILILCVLCTFSVHAQIPFVKGLHKRVQLKHERVQEAFKNKSDKLLETMQQLKIAKSLSNDIFFRVIKNEQCLEVWLKPKGEQSYRWFYTYFFCSNSGALGPKRMEGDFQIPEGFYQIDRFNPESEFHLSIGINYPNRSDLILGNKQAPGRDIFIHGSCVTVGCMPVNDEWIQEIYVLAVEAIDAGQTKVPIHIFPFRMTEENFAIIKAKHPEKYAQHEAFWRDLKVGYDLFEMHYLIPEFTIQADGRYIVTPPKNLPAPKPTITVEE
jgi:murein L,D-transpeptidase YafK